MKKILLILVLFFVVFGIDAATPGASFAAKPQAGFTENKGQIVDQNRQQNKDVLFLLNSNGLNVQIRKGGFSYDTYTIERKAKEQTQDKDLPKNVKNVQDSFDYIYHYHRIDLDFIGSNPKADFEAIGKSVSYTNYYNVDAAPNGILDVRNYDKVYVKNIYAGIDIEYVVDPQKGFKYNFIVHPGADLGQLQIQSKGAPIKLKNNSIFWQLSAGKLEESIPMSWYNNDTNELATVGYQILSENSFGFALKGNVENTKTLTIDPLPDRLWSTYIGGSGNDYLEGLTTDLSGNVYSVGWTYSPNNIATAGAAQVVNGGSGTSDVFVSEYGVNGTFIWSSYFGGLGDDVGNAISFDKSGAIYFSGRTYSLSGIASFGSFNGSSDAFLIKLTLGGVKTWGTYFGGNADDVSFTCKFDNFGNIYIAGYSNSSAGLSTPGAFQTAASLPIFWDGFIAKFSSLGALQWASYLGGTGIDLISSCETDSSGNVYFAGFTESANGIASAGAHQFTYGGSGDAFLVKFNSSGVRLWGTYMGGSSRETYSYCGIDASANIYLSGSTSSTNNISMPGAYMTAMPGSSTSNYVSKFNSNGVRLWSTYFGGNYLDYVNALCLKGNNIFITGATQSTSNFASVGAYQTVFAGSNDAYLTRFNLSGIMSWTTYFGKSDFDMASACAADSLGNIYIGGRTYSITGMASTGVQQTIFGGSSTDGFLAKFYANCTNGTLGTIGTITTTTAPNCSGVIKNYTIPATTNANSYNWIVPVSWKIISGQGTNSINISLGATGSISVRAYNGCGDSTAAASLAVTTTTNATPSAIAGSATPCYGVAATYSVTLVAGNTYEWVLPSTWGGSPSSNSILVNAFATPATGGDSIFVRAISTTTSCPSAYVKKRVDAKTSPAIPSNLVGYNPACRNIAMQYSVDSVPYADNYTWTFPAGWTLGTPANGRQIIVTPGASAVSGNVTVKGNNATCGAGLILTQTLLNPVAMPAAITAIVGASNVCNNAMQTYSVSPSAGANYYRWIVPSDWTIISGQGTTSLSVKVGTMSGFIYAQAAVASAFSCASGPQNLYVTVTLPPAAPTAITGPAEVCINGNYAFNTNIVAATTSYAWTLPSGFTIASGNGTNSININTPASLSASNQISVTAINGSCASAATNYTFTGNNTIPAQPDAIIGSNIICANSSQNYSIPAVSSALSYTWTYPNTWTVNGASNQNSISLIAGSNTGAISVKANNGACVSPVRSFSINTVSPNPTSPGLISYSGVNCSGKSNTLSIAAVSGASSYTWTLPTGWSGSSTGTSIAVIPGIKSDTVMVTASNGTCNSLPRKQVIAAYSTPSQPGTISGASTICISSQNIYKLNRQSNVSNYIWTWPTNYTVVSNADTAQTIVPNSSALSGNLSIVANNNGCQSTATLFPITINNTLPGTPGGIIGGTSICNGIPKTFSVGLIPNALSYKWSIPATWSILSGQNTSQVSIKSDNTTGQITVKSINGVCESAAQILNINSVLTPPSAPIISANLNPCKNQNALFAVSNAAGGSVIWTAPVGWTISNQNQANTNILIAGLSGNITAKINNGNCEGPDTSLNIVAITTPIFTEILGEQYVKANAVRSYSVATMLGTTYAWSIPAGWHALGGNGANAITVMTGNTSGQITVTGQNSCGTSAPFAMNVYSGVSAGMDEFEVFGDLKVYPQPAKDFFKLKFTSLKQLDHPKIILVDMLGKVVFTRFEPTLVSGQMYEGTFSCEGLTPGVYFLQIQANNISQSIKFLIRPL